MTDSVTICIKLLFGYSTIDIQLDSKETVQKQLEVKLNTMNKKHHLKHESQFVLEVSDHIGIKFSLNNLDSLLVYLNTSDRKRLNASQI